MGFLKDLFGGSDELDELKKQQKLFETMSAMNAGGCTDLPH